MPKKNTAKKPSAQKAPQDRPDNIPDPLAFSKALAETYERAQPIFEQAFARYSSEFADKSFDPFNIREAYNEYVESFMNEPEQFWSLQKEYWEKYFELCGESTKKFLGEKSHSVISPEKGDRRFKTEDWQENAVFDFIKQSYLLTCEWMDKSVRTAEGLDDEKKEKLAFYTEQFANALSPSNFVLTNPDVLRETLDSGGDNLIRGLENLLSDLERGQGELKISTTNYDAFKLGDNIATTPGSVVYQNDLIQLIQYEPQTTQVYKRPLLIVPPWINKYYILDLRSDNSYIKWAVKQGHTVFVISWVNPDAKLAQKRFENYMQEGIIASIDQIKEITGEPDCNVVGYCLGGTLLTITLSYLESIGQSDRIASATFLTTLIDFEHAGDLKLFMDDGQLEMMNRELAEKGVLQAKRLQQTFSLLRSNDLIWSFVVNNYLMGKEPFPFDLLYWNDDSTNMPAAMHSFYLRKLYRDNLLKEPGGISMDKTSIDPTQIKTPAYFLSTREDHIAPWKATYQGTQLLSGDVTFTLAASGHIAGVVNPPGKNKYCYWTANKAPKDPKNWLKSAKEHDGSWWPHWQKWLSKHAGTKIPAKKIKKGLEAAPGSYVKMGSD